MSRDHSALSALRAQHPAWRLLAAAHAPLVGSFLHRVFITPNVRVMAQSELLKQMSVGSETNAQSLLMDLAPLHAHAEHWGLEPQPLVRDLPRLTPAEAEVYNTLRDQTIRPHLRLEQERLSFGWVQRALAGLSAQLGDIS